MCAHLLEKSKEINPEWQVEILKNTLLTVSLILDSQYVFENLNVLSANFLVTIIQIAVRLTSVQKDGFGIV